MTACNCVTVSVTTVMFFASLFHSASPSNLCSTIGLCCKHRDSHCVAQRIQANHTVDTSELPCYCDHACLRLDDCCSDYKQFCGVMDCKVSEWGPWSPCSSTCGIGNQERRRIVLHQPSNGGLNCPYLVQSKQCKGTACNTQDNEDNLDINQNYVKGKDFPTMGSIEEETSQEMNHGFAEGKNHGFETGHGLTHNLSEATDPNKSCMEMVIVRSSIGCKHHDDRLHMGTRICVQCSRESDSRRHLPTCNELTESPIRKFRISEHCHGKLTFLSRAPNDECGCSHGLHFELVI